MILQEFGKSELNAVFDKLGLPPDSGKNAD